MHKLKKKVAELVVFQIISLIARLFYFAGLTVLIPLMPLVLSPHELPAYRQAFAVAIGSIIVGFALVFYFSKSRKTAWRVLGLFTLIPGLLAVIFSYLGSRRMAEFLGSFGNVSPYLEFWIETYVPKAWLLAGLYIIVGVGFIWFGEKSRK
jgi:hypothetical protein